MKILNELERCNIAKEKGFSYNPKTGKIKGERNKQINGKNYDGYIIIQIKDNGKIYRIYAHRLAWFLFYGDLPVNSIDHINGVRDDNRINNLRDITHQKNQWNQKNRKGYRFHKLSNKWQARITIDGKQKHLGLFENENDAKNAYLQAKEKIHNI